MEKLQLILGIAGFVAIIAGLAGKAIKENKEAIQGFLKLKKWFDAAKKDGISPTEEKTFLKKCEEVGKETGEAILANRKVVLKIKEKYGQK